ncbi:hypothetical protein SAY86_009956 [Trapa natans]|uniref:Uncharacterized protein n=1 Tax=Trapa natans TaxID=22666 RepID=A0AAN7QRN2_TRANT|nr:hypothetical protein SAY86_009956 [Trapa natans]
MKTPPSFSSIILDKICRSIDEEADALLSEPVSHQYGSKCIIDKTCRFDLQDPHVREILEACQLGDENIKAKAESIHNGVKQNGSNFTVPPPVVRPKTMRASSVSATLFEKPSKPEKSMRDRRQRVPRLLEHWRTTTPPIIQGCGHRCLFCNSMGEAQARAHQVDDSSRVTKAKPRTLRFYENLTKIKRPVSPGGRLSNFMDSLFAAAWKAKKPKSSSGSNIKRSPTTTMPGQQAFSAACSFSRSSSLSRNSLLPAVTWHKRTDRLSPSLGSIVDEDLSKLLDCRKTMSPAAIPTNCQARCSVVRRKLEDDAIVLAQRYNAVARDRKPRRIEKLEMDYYWNQKPYRCTRSGWESHRALCGSCVTYDDYDDDDASSSSSSDLFELDHLRYWEELPVYEATWVSRNLTIANGLMKV